jgi:hypothetical protein
MDLDATVNVTGKALTAAVTVSALFLGGGLIAVLLMQAVGLLARCWWPCS